MNGPRRLRLWATPVLLAVLVVLVLVFAYKKEALSWEWLRSNKDALAALNSVCTTIVAVVAGVFAYYRFFRGRTLTVRVDLAIAVDVIDSPAGSLLQLACVTAKNIGTTTIWEPRVHLHVVARHVDGRESEFEVKVDEWLEVSDLPLDKRPRISALDSGESAEFSSERSFGPDIWAVTYTAVLTCMSGDAWSTKKIVGRARPGRAEPAKLPTSGEPASPA